MVHWKIGGQPHITWLDFKCNSRTPGILWIIIWGELNKLKYERTHNLLNWWDPQLISTCCGSILGTILGRYYSNRKNELTSFWKHGQPQPAVHCHPETCPGWRSRGRPSTQGRGWWWRHQTKSTMNQDTLEVIKMGSCLPNKVPFGPMGGKDSRTPVFFYWCCLGFGGPYLSSFRN